MWDADCTSQTTRNAMWTSFKNFRAHSWAKCTTSYKPFCCTYTNRWQRRFHSINDVFKFFFNSKIMHAVLFLFAHIAHAKYLKIKYNTTVQLRLWLCHLHTLHELASGDSKEYNLECWQCQSRIVSRCPLVHYCPDKYKFSACVSFPHSHKFGWASGQRFPKLSTKNPTRGRECKQIIHNKF